MSSAEIHAAHEAITDKDAIMLALTLDNGFCPGKDFRKLNQELVEDGEKPHERVRAMLSSAYDWFAWGN